MKVLIIDNYDSFTFNLFQYVGELLTAGLGAGQFELIVKRNDELSLDDIIGLNPDRIIISPGPGSPDNEAYFGVCAQAISHLGKTTPLLGVCLGMQGIVHVFGGKIVKAKLPMHGKSSPITHDAQGIFVDIPQGLEVMRYHSLIAEAASFPSCLEITAYIQMQEQAGFDETILTRALMGHTEIMAVRHKQFPIQGIQFHPESFASEGGREMIDNFLWQR
jgi:anthranilate synthase component II